MTKNMELSALQAEMIEEVRKYIAQRSAPEGALTVAQIMAHLNVGRHKANTIISEMVSNGIIKRLDGCVNESGTPTTYYVLEKGNSLTQ